MRADPLPVASGAADAVATARDELDRARTAGSKVPPTVLAALHAEYRAACLAAGVLAPPKDFRPQWSETPKALSRKDNSQ